MHDPSEYINNDIYPLNNPGSKGWKDLVVQCRSSLKNSGVCIIKKFVKEHVIKKVVQEANQSVHLSHFCKDSHNVFFEKDNELLPDDHPLRVKENTSLNSIPYDLMKPNDILYQLYNWDPLMNFLSPILGHKLYRMADPMAALTINCMGKNQNHGWHYDESQVTITLLIQKPVSGGLFQFVPNLRNKDSDGFSSLGAVLGGDHKNVVTLDIDPGDLLIFSGFFSLHRVTPVKGEKIRYVGTFCYKDRPNVLNSPEVQKLFYGRINQG